jgi:SpoIID/LytB domain protein
MCSIRQFVGRPTTCLAKRWSAPPRQFRLALSERPFVPTTRSRRLSRLGLASLLATTLAAGPGSVAAHANGQLPAPQPGAQITGRSSDGTFAVAGHGFGHGVGMSQYGANGAARSGLSYRQILAFYYPGTLLTSLSSPTIRVGITSDTDGIVEVAAAPGLTASSDGVVRRLPTTPDRWRVRVVVGGCVLEARTAGNWSKFPLRQGEQNTPCPVMFTATGHLVRLVLPGGVTRAYRGSITAQQVSSGKVVTVNRVNLESYLRSVVPAESPAYFHLEALRAQAVAARTYAKRFIRAGGSYDICDSTACQVYKGVGVVNSRGSINAAEQPATDAAVTDTAGQVLTYAFAAGRAPQLATTMFSASNGGQAVAGGAGHGYLTAHPDPYDRIDNPWSSWTRTVRATSLEKAYGINRVARIQVLSRDGRGDWGGRPTSIRVEGFTSDGRYRATDTTGRSLGAVTGLPSDYFTFEETATVDPATLYRRYGGTTLQAGARGIAVKAVQVLLTEAGHDAGPADGVWGGRTSAALRAFQVQKKLPLDTDVTRNDWRALSGLSYTQARPASKTAPKTLYQRYRTTVLRTGSRGTAVRALQSELNRRGLKVGRVDGVFGVKTRGGVVRLQRARHLTATGVVRASTWKALSR